MFNSKTYFEQVPLEFVKQIIEEQVRVDGADETLEGIEKEVPNEVPQEGRPIPGLDTIANVRSLKQP